jgi:hypothetical protein
MDGKESTKKKGEKKGKNQKPYFGTEIKSVTFLFSSPSFYK